MIRAYAAADVRAAEAHLMATTPPGSLMQRAAAGLATAVLGELTRCHDGAYGRHVVLLVGGGNNGADALWAGARLLARGVAVDAVDLADRPTDDAVTAFTTAGGRWHPIDSATGAHQILDRLLPTADLVVDGILGLGAKPGLRDAAAEAARSVLAARVPVVAVDLPSGVDPDAGTAVVDSLPADLTVTFGVCKPCLLLPPTCRTAGRVVRVDIGLREGFDATGATPAVERLTDADVARIWPRPDADDDKYRRGVLGIVAGSVAYTGAALLTVGAALRTGVGMVRYVGPEHATELVRQRWPEAVTGQGRVQAWVVGPGVDPESGAGQRRATGTAFGAGVPVLVDAGALALLPPRVTTPTLLTPHAGELARLLTARGQTDVSVSDVQADPLVHARRAADLTGATVLIKGAVTVIASPDGRVRSQAEGPPWLATAGAGDVLAGVAGALLAGGLDPLDAGSAAALVHGRAGDLASDGGPVSASDVTQAVPDVVAALLRATPGKRRRHSDRPRAPRPGTLGR